MKPVPKALYLAAAMTMTLSVYAPTARAQTLPCENSEVGVEEYVRTLSADTPTLETLPIHQKVPREFSIEHEAVEYIVTPAVANVDFAPVRMFHTTNGKVWPGSRAAGGLRYMYRFVSLCRVRNGSGEAWLAIRAIDNSLQYVPAADVERYDVYKKAAEKARREREMKRSN